MSTNICMRKIQWCSARKSISYNKGATAGNNPNISQNMRYGQMMTSTTNEGRKKRITVYDMSQLSPGLVPRQPTIVPLRN